MKSIKNRWLRGVGAVVLVSGFIIMGWGLGVTSAAPASNNPLQTILDKLDQIIDHLKHAGREHNHTLRWDTNHPSASRYTTAFPGAVLDKNTGLVWEQAPDGPGQIWGQAAHYCINKNVGGTVGWRLPSIAELKSVQDVSPGAVSFVPASVFTGIFNSFYWSATRVGVTPTNGDGAWGVEFFSGLADPRAIRDGFAWCVRGPMNADTY